MKRSHHRPKVDTLDMRGTTQRGGRTMGHIGLVVYGSWADWLTISGYISFGIFITWCVLTRSSPD